MSWSRKVFGLEAFDLVMHGLITGGVLFWILAVNVGRDVPVFASFATVASLIVLDIRRRLALRRLERKALSAEPAEERIAELEQRVAELEFDRARLAELEERLDFAERLLATPRDPVRELAP